ncbi:thermonuclease family protein [bacterium LRH843]|nr:thermonuclease family protein [bacterium LRH843]
MPLYWLVFGLLFVGCGLNTEQLNSEYTLNQFEEIVEHSIEATVSKVVDGDTINVRLENGHEEKVRLLLIDTPESVHPAKPVQPFGIEASEFTNALLEKGTMVRVELDVGERDRYGRLLAYVWIGEVMLNELLLQEGLARVAYVFEPNTKYVDKFYQLQQEAQSKGVGIWSIENYVLEEGFNEEAEMKKVTDHGGEFINHCANPAIKGNLNSKGERIYHVPDGQYYVQTIPEELFCTEEEAEAAGFRKSKR